MDIIIEEIAEIFEGKMKGKFYILQIQGFRLKQ
jgi:hypothetical protein